MPRAALAALLAALMPAAAQAACADLTVLSCTAEGGGKQIEVCATATDLTYAFGPPGKPELTLSEPLAGGTYTPWAGFGRAIWESVGFRNAGYVYEAWFSFDRLDENAMIEGGVNVISGDDLVAQVTCDPGTVEAAFDPLFARMEAAGFCRNREEHRWQRGGCPD